jgi:hypothetical protein
MKRMVLLFACLAFMSTAIQAGELFRWTDREGRVNYGDTPPLDASNVGKVNLSSEPAQNDDLPYETRIAQQNFPVTLYVGTGCGEPCDHGRSLLNKRGIPFKEKVLKTKQDIEAFRQLSGMEGFIPVLQVGKNFLKGFSESQWNSELDIAGYAKTASYRQRIAPPAPANPEATQQPVEKVPSTPAESAQ